MERPFPPPSASSPPPQATGGVCFVSRPAARAGGPPPTRWIWGKAKFFLGCDCEGGGFFARSPPAPSRRGCVGRFWGEAASLREAPLPRPPLPKSGWRLGWTFLLGWFRLRVGGLPIGWVVVTAADRAAATFEEVGIILSSRPSADSSFCGGEAMDGASLAARRSRPPHPSGSPFIGA